ncbi:MAG: hypothetical protein NXY57DRAFT_447842 [Lentinula lateritia]|nr:MAG: hypothetical protein NXY57DRAFT_447842 [Lentinula lateritia]
MSVSKLIRSFSRWFKQGLDCSVVPALTPTVSDICGSFLTASDLLPSLLEVWSLEWLFIMLCPHALFKTPVAFSPGTPMWSHATYFSKIILWGSKVTGHDDSWYFTCCLFIVANISWSQTLDAQYPVLKTSARPDGAREFIHSRFFLSSVRPLTRCLRILLSSKVHPLSSCRLASSEKCMGAIVIIVPDRSVSMSNRKFPRRRRSECAS